MKSTKKRTSRCKRCNRCNRCKTNRRHQRAKGGMFRRSATKAAKTVLEGVFGKGPDRVEKMYQLGQAVANGVEGATKATITKGYHSSARSFEDIASPQSQFHISHVENPNTSRMSYNSYDSDENPNYKTPKKPTSSTEPKLERRRQSQTPKTRAQRLSSIVAPTVGQPTPLAARLSFGDDDKNDE